MAISDNTKKRYNETNKAYQESDEIKRKRQQAQALMNSRPQEKQNTFADQISSIYNKIKNRNDFSYNPENDKLYQQYAKTYKALGDLAMAETLSEAQGLTGGYGSTYSPTVAMQTNEAYQNNVTDTLPEFYQMAQDIYNSKVNMLNDQMATAIDSANRQDESYLNQYNAWNEAMALAGGIVNQDSSLEQQAQQDLRNLWAEQYWQEQNAQNDEQELLQNSYWNEQNLKEDNRQFNKELQTDITENKRSEKWEKYDSNQSIIASKCADYNDKGDNKGMKSYLDKQVKNGNITQYMADELYKKYKYTAPKTRSGSSGGTGGKKWSHGDDLVIDNPGDDKTVIDESNFNKDEMAVIKGYTDNNPLSKVKSNKQYKSSLYKNMEKAFNAGKLTEEEFAYLCYYYDM